jgi:uracil-DNA glycosylase
VGCKNLHKYLQKEYSTTECYPPKALIFNAFSKAKFADLKIVIVGQDPYIKENEAMGMSFSVPKATKCPPSLQ